MILEAIKTLREKDDSFLVFEIKRLKPTRPGQINLIDFQDSISNPNIILRLVSFKKINMNR